MPRFYFPGPLSPELSLNLTGSVAKHIQVLRLQPGEEIVLFNSVEDGRGVFNEYAATILAMSRSTVDVLIGATICRPSNPVRSVHVAVGMPANDRMDWLIEKVTELGVTSIQPLMTERSVLRLLGERSLKKGAHWQSIAIAASEQSGGVRVPTIHPVMSLSSWLQIHSSNANALNILLSLDVAALPFRRRLLERPSTVDVWCLSGPEGGLSHSEELLAAKSGFLAATLGSRILRAETAAIAAVATAII